MPNREAVPAPDLTTNGEKETPSTLEKTNSGGISGTLSIPSNPAALFTTLLIVTKTNGKTKRLLIQGQWQNNLQAITNGRGSHWSWFTSEGGYIVKIEDVSELEVYPFNPESNAAS